MYLAKRVATAWFGLQNRNTRLTCSAVRSVIGSLASSPRTVADAGERWATLLESVLGATPREFESRMLRHAELRDHRFGTDPRPRVDHEPAQYPKFGEGLPGRGPPGPPPHPQSA